jgi:hypothetical protein
MVSFGVSFYLLPDPFFMVAVRARNIDKKRGNLIVQESTKGREKRQNQRNANASLSEKTRVCHRKPRHTQKDCCH